jgi:predicted component of type VI protein secretion system
MVSAIIRTWRKAVLLRITVLQYKGAPPPAALAYMFDERGGNIGREGCHLTLPDETRVLSRVQAEIVFADGLFNLIDQGGNPSIVNGLRVGKGISRALYDGDIIELCDYKLRVKAIGTAQKSGGDTIPMRAIDPMPSLDLVPPILLDPDELTGAPEIIVQAEPTEANLDMTFEMDVDFTDLDPTETPGHFESARQPNDPTATVGLDVPLDAPLSAMTNPSPFIDNTCHTDVLSALCLGLGVAAPQTSGAMQPQHMGIVMRRAMQHALTTVLASFTPEDLAKRLADRAVLDMPAPLDRKSKLWEIFEQHHAEISHEAEDHFHSLFGSEFLKACEAQVNRLREHN